MIGKLKKLTVPTFCLVSEVMWWKDVLLFNQLTCVPEDSKQEVWAGSLCKSQRYSNLVEIITWDPSTAFNY